MFVLVKKNVMDKQMSKQCSSCFKEFNEIGYIDKYDRLICLKCRTKSPYTYQQFCDKCRKYIRESVSSIDVPLFFVVIHEYSARRLCKDGERLKGINYCEKCYKEVFEK